MVPNVAGRGGSVECAETFGTREESAATEFDEFKAASEWYVADFDRGDLPMPPARGVAVVTCMDARLHPEKFLGSRWSAPSSSPPSVCWARTR
jgi:hypothetical protein